MIPEDKDSEEYAKAVWAYIDFLKESGNPEWAIDDSLFFAINETTSFRLRRVYRNENPDASDTHVVVRQVVPDQHQKRYLADQQGGELLDRMCQHQFEPFAIVLWRRLEKDAPPLFDIKDAVSEAIALARLADGACEERH